MKYNEYHWRNIPREAEGTASFDQPQTELEALRLVNEWNQRDGEVWQYWV